MAMNTPSTRISVISPVKISRSLAPVTDLGLSVPTTSSKVAFQITLTFGFAKSRFCRIFSARNELRRWTTVTVRANLVRKDRFLDGGIAAADHEHVLSPVEKAVARCAGRDAVATIALFARKTEPASLRSRADDDRIRMIVRPAIAVEDEGRAGKIDRHDVVLHDLGADMQRLRAASAP